MSPNDRIVTSTALLLARLNDRVRLAADFAERWRWHAGDAQRAGDLVLARRCRLCTEIFAAIAAGDVIQGRFITPGGVLAGGLQDGMLEADRGA